ncbi:hypothetical protein DFH08DRAFT_875967 [Mycena albidolilacea]|uniref:Uncharacterized protein n=1 Tax=Mycena albidolilacea TaxID=1033008 RepID=A0AAD7ELW7_9AGAR|nr:hypothetical protein DFH08DRAFT_875967 [Mycena albidolilacea]
MLALTLHGRSSNLLEPRLPRELESKISETAAIARPVSISRLMLVARRVKLEEWVEPFLYHVALLSFPSLTREPLNFGLPTFTDDAVPHQRPGCFERIKHLFIGYDFDASEADGWLTACRSVTNLYLLISPSPVLRTLAPFTASNISQSMSVRFPAQMSRTPYFEPSRTSSSSSYMVSSRQMKPSVWTKISHSSPILHILPYGPNGDMSTAPHPHSDSSPRVDELRQGPAWRERKESHFRVNVREFIIEIATPTLIRFFISSFLPLPPFLLPLHWPPWTTPGRLPAPSTAQYDGESGSRAIIGMRPC